MDKRSQIKTRIKSKKGGRRPSWHQPSPGLGIPLNDPMQFARAKSNSSKRAGCWGVCVCHSDL